MVSQMLDGVVKGKPSPLSFLHMFYKLLKMYRL